ncbi:MAG: DUF6658 family protein [Xenococcaceae cyanobacterium]
MIKVKDILKNLQLQKVFTAFLLLTVLLITTACNSGDEFGARPDNLPVQMGGNNNPHKGGDGYTQYKVDTDPRLQKNGDNASLMQFFDRAIAAQPPNKTAPQKKEGILYPGDSGQPDSLRNKDDFYSAKEQKELMNPSQFPEKQQTQLNRADPDAKILEKTGEAVKDASKFLGDSK